METLDDVIKLLHRLYQNGDSLEQEISKAHEILIAHKSLLIGIPRDRMGIPINPCKRYRTTQGVECRARFITIFDVTVLDGDRFRTTTESDVIQIG